MVHKGNKGLDHVCGLRINIVLKTLYFFFMFQKKRKRKKIVDNQYKLCTILYMRSFNEKEREIVA